MLYENRIKTYVPVEALFDEAGQIHPRTIQWEDGRVFAIDQILDVRPAASLKAGGQGIRYTCPVSYTHLRYGWRVHAVGGTDGGRERGGTPAEKEEAQERKEFVNHMYNKKTLKDERGKLSGRHLRMP